VFTAAGVPSGSVSHVSTKEMIGAEMGSRHTDVDDIALTQLSLVWNAMTDDFVDGPVVVVVVGRRVEWRDVIRTCKLILGNRDS
jgi:hypothetical protein